MNMRSSQFRLSLLATTCCALLLCACGNNPFSSTAGRKEQHVDGPRRHPSQNPCFRTGSPADPTPPCLNDSQDIVPQVAPVPAPASSPKQAAPSPFDEYDASGNKISAAPAAPATPQPTEDSAEGGSFFKRLFSAPAEPQGSEPERKSFMAEPVASPQAELPAASTRHSTPPAGFVPVASGPAASVQAKPSDMPQDGASRPSFFSRLLSPLTKGDDAPKEAPKADTGEYPALTSVPETPSALKDAKAGNNEKLEELQMNHAMAQEDKQALDAEPSQTQPQPQPQLAMPAPVAADGASPQLLGHISDSSLPAASAPVAPEPAPVPVAVEPAMPEEKPVPVNTEPAKTVAQPAAVEPMVPAVPAAADDSVAASSVPEFKPLPPQNAPAPQADADSADNEAGHTAADSGSAPKTGSSLPDPGSLQKVKALPPSRYQERARDRQYYLVP